MSKASKLEKGAQGGVHDMMYLKGPVEGGSAQS